MANRVYRIGTRGSALALWQANWVAAELRGRGHTVELVPIKTSGDQSQADVSPVRGFGGVGVFVKELERALLQAEIDLAVHSLKDLPTERVEGLCLAAVPERAPVEDVLISRENLPLAKLPSQARVGTGSARRRALLMHHRNDLRMLEIRGNVDTRLAKLRAGDYDAIVLARAGLERLGWADQATEILPLEWMLPAVGQGALGIEARANDAELLVVLAALDHANTHAAVKAERTLLAELRAGCLAPVGAWARIDESSDQLLLNATVASTDGIRRIDVTETGLIAAPEEIGRQAAARLRDAGADEIIAAERGRE